MNIKSKKDGFTPLEAAPPSRGTYFRWRSLTGFTLLEILVAMALIVTIVSMVYASYFATSKSTQIYKARMELYQQGQNVLKQMARQIRCSYSGTDEKHTYASQQAEIPKNDVHCYFNGNPEEPTGEILHLVTTNGPLRDQKPAPTPVSRQEDVGGLFDVIYKFDKNSGALFLSQERFIGASTSVVGKRNWRPIAKNVECIELSFFDGLQWLNKWDFKDNMKLPCAVKIEIICEDENYQQCHCGTIAYISCQANQGKEVRPKTLVSAKKP